MEQLRYFWEGSVKRVFHPRWAISMNTMDSTRLFSATMSASTNSIEHFIIYPLSKITHLYGISNKRYHPVASSNSSVHFITTYQSRLHLLYLLHCLVSSSSITQISKHFQSMDNSFEEFSAMHLIWRFMVDSRITNFMMCSM